MQNAIYSLLKNNKVELHPSMGLTQRTSPINTNNYSIYRANAYNEIQEDYLQ
jgi:hypothetical protein